MRGHPGGDRAVQPRPGTGVARRVGAQQHLLSARGPAEFELAHEAIRQLEAGRAEYVSLTFPVALLTDFSTCRPPPSPATPSRPSSRRCHHQLNTGPEPWTWRSGTPAAPPPPSAFGWARRPTTLLASSVAPFGIIEAETGGNLYVVILRTYTNHRGSAGIKTTVSAGGSASATFAVDPSTMEADDFHARHHRRRGLGAHRDRRGCLPARAMTLSLEPFAGTSFARRSTPRSSASRRQAVGQQPSSGAKFRPVRLRHAGPCRWTTLSRSSGTSSRSPPRQAAPAF